jgi:acyl-CoA thioester hydrolase
VTSRSVELRVRYAETDQMGVVYYANYLVWCEIGRTEFIRSFGPTYAELEQEGVYLAVADAAVRYHSPARYDDLVRVETSLAEVRSRTIRFLYAIFNAESNRKLASAETTLMCMTRDGRASSLPPDFRASLEALR